MSTLQTSQEKRNRDFSILHNPRFGVKEPTPLWAEEWTPKQHPYSCGALEETKENPQFYSTQQIYKKVIEWFESWRPWQQRSLLCGMTNRFSIQQLKSLATTLEPVFHRDFVNTLKDRYPSASLRKIRKTIRAKRGKGTKYKGKPTKNTSKLANRSGSSAFTRQFSLSTNNEDGVFHINKGISRETTMDLDENDDSPEQLSQQSNLYNMNNVEQFAQQFINNVFNDALKSLGGESSLPYSENVAEVSLLPRDSRNINENSLKSKAGGNPSLSKLDKYLGDLSVKSDYIQHTGELLKHHHNTIRGHRLDSRTKSGGSETLATRSREEKRFDAQHEKHFSSMATPEMKHRDFFEQSKSFKLGPVQAQLRSGSVRKPPNIQDLYIPVQNMYKHEKFWSESMSAGDRVNVKPNRVQLKRQFTRQLNQIWDWMSGWKENERLSLLAAVVKLCSSDQTSFLAQCLFDRLHERIDINWLPDRLLLLIFSYLPVHEIQKCSKVSRKWKYLTNVDELWMVKCHEYGIEQGIDDITDIVVNASSNENSIDWKQAYLEIQNITENVKSTLLVPPKLDFEVDTPEGMQKVGGKLLPDEHKENADVVSDSESYGATVQSPDIVPSREAVGRQTDSLPQTDKKGPSLGRRTHMKGLKTKERVGCETESEKKSEINFDNTKKLTKNVTLKTENIATKEKSPKVVGDNRTEISENEIQNVDENNRLGRRKSRKKTSDEEDEYAKDVRHNLRQSHDLKIGRKNYQHTWTKHQIETARSNLDNIAGPTDNIARVRKLQGHMDSVLCVETDGRRLVSGSMDRAVRIWEIRNGRSVHKLLGHKGGVTHIQFSGDILYTGSWDTCIMVWELLFFQRRCVLSGHSGSISGLKLNVEQRILLSSSHDGTVRVWSTISHMIMEVLPIHAQHQVLSMDYDGTNIVTSGSDRTIKVTDLKSKECTRVIHKHPGPPERLLVSTDLCITTNFSGQVFFWDLTTGSLEAGIQAHDSPVKALSHFNGRIYTASADGSIKEWDLVTLSCIRTLQGHRGPVNNVSATSKFIVTCSTDGHIRVWDREMPKAGGEEDSIRLQVIDHRNTPKVAVKSAESTRS